MTAATITTSFDNVPLATDHKILTVSDDHTYVTRLGQIAFVHATWADEDASTNPPTITWTGRTIKISAANVTSKKLALSVYGRP